MREPDIRAWPDPAAIRRWIVEIFVIALGILLAFAVDAGWGALQDAEQERRTLEALREEFEGNIAELQRVEEAHRNVVESSRALLRMTGPTAVATEEASTLIGEVWVPVVSTLASGASRALMATDDLSRVRDAELRRALGAWPDRVAGFKRLEDYLFRMTSDRLVPLIQTRLPQIQIELAGGFSGWPELRAEFRRTVEPSRFEGDVAALLRDLEFENVVLLRLTISMIARESTRDLAQAAGQTLQLINRSLR